jgi:hypothetical protein
VITTAESSTFLFLSGEWKVVAGQSGEMIEAPFTAEGKLVGGSGKFQRISGPMVVNWKSAAFPRRTPKAAIGGSLPACAKAQSRVWPLQL